MIGWSDENVPVGRTTIQWAGTQNKFLHTRWRKLRETLLEARHTIVAPPQTLGMEIEYAVVVEKNTTPYEFSLINGREIAAVGLPCAVADEADILAIAKAVAECLRPQYGFATVIDAPQSSLFYSSGMPFNTPPGLEFEQLLQFQGSKYSGAYVDKRLRDVYPINFLSGGHLALIVNGVPLRTWIEKRNIGELTPLCGDLWTWQLPDEAIAGVRNILNRAGALIVTL